MLAWVLLLANSKVLFRSDNIAVVHVINSQTYRCERIMRLVRLFVLQCLKFNILFKARHIPGHVNESADALSRFQMARFRAAVPLAESTMTPLPPLPVIW